MNPVKIAQGARTFESDGGKVLYFFFSCDSFILYI